MNRLNDKVAIVTGGAQGLGYAIAAKFAEHGAAVVITDIDHVNGQHAADAIGKLNDGRCLFLQQDVTNETRWQQVVDTTLTQFSDLHILVNNAGIVRSASIEDETLAGWRATQAVNLDAVFMGTQVAVRAMKHGRGSIINVSSIEGLVGEPSIPAYNASKAGVRLLTKSAALHCAKQGYAVRVNSLHPGYILTKMVEDGLNSLGEQAWEMATKLIPAGAFGEPDDIAFGALYLASDESKYMTGSELVIDGGYTAQ